MYLKQKEEDALTFLAQYKLLCSSQLTELELYKNKGDVTKLLKPMAERKKPLIGVIKFPPAPTIGQLEYIYYLTKFGEKVLLEDYIRMTVVPRRRPWFHRRPALRRAPARPGRKTRDSSGGH